MARQVSNLLLYKQDISPPCCAVMMLADVLGLKLHYKEPNILTFQHKSEEFKQMNPIGTIPVLQDGDFYLSQSHAILKYLLAKYGGEHQEKLYPSDLRTRATIDQCLFFDASTFFIRLRSVAIPTLFLSLAGPKPWHLANIEEAYSVLEAYLQKNEYIAANNFTIADISLGATASGLQAVHKFDVNKYPRSVEWFSLLNKESCFQSVSGAFSLLSNVLNTSWERNKKNLIQI